MALSNTLGTDLATMARRIQAQGRGHDTVLAHITPEEAALLKARGGRGSRNPATGLLEFDYGTEYVTVQAPSYTPPPIIDVSSLNIPRQQAQAPAPQQPAGPGPLDQATVSADREREQGTPDTFFYEPMAPLQAPQFSALPTPAAPDAPAALDSVTTSATKRPEPVISGAGLVVPPGAEPAPEQSTSKDIKDWLGNNSTLLTILGLGGLGAFGASNSAKSGQQAQELQKNLAGLAEPQLAAGKTALSATQAGGLTPQNQRALDAARAQTAQAQSTGAVSSQQAAEAVSMTYANLLNTQLNQALTLLNSADSYLQQAYLKGYEANVTNQANTTTFYSNLAQLAARLSGVDSGVPTTPRVA